jgi:hypothetical protein
VEYKKFDAIVSFSFLNLLRVYIFINTTGSIGTACHFVNALNPGIYDAGSGEKDQVFAWLMLEKDE